MKRLIFKRVLPLVLAMDLIIAPAVVPAGPNIPGFYGGVGNLAPPAANALPEVQTIVQGVSGLEKVGDNRLVIHQDADKAVIDWQTFDIGANAWTHFDQQGNTHWSALNRIYDKNPSQIFGRLSADGNVYLINQNGMMFSPGATVDVHGLAASSLNIANDVFNHDDFMSKETTFAAENYQGAENYDPTAAVVANHGTIQTDDKGEVMLLGPTVENSGSISAPLGRIVMGSGTEVTMEEDLEGGTVNFKVDAKGDSQEAVNLEGGCMASDSGYIGMFGRVVNQDGVIRAVTAVRKNGRIELKATETLKLGKSSETASPISTSADTVHESFEFTSGDISLTSGDQLIVEGSIVAPSGTVELEADNRIYLDGDSRIDVSGSWVEKSAEDAVASVQLNSVELRDEYQQKQDILQGQTVCFNVVEGSAIGDVSGTLTSTEKTALENSTNGGQIYLTSKTGEVIARSGAVLDFSGGGIIYNEGFTETTLLVSGNRIYRIEDASGEIEYDAVIGPDQEMSSTGSRFGITETHDGTYHMGSANSLRNFSAEYQEGDAAGSLDVQSPVLVLNATLDGSVTTGIFQTSEDDEDDGTETLTTLGTVIPKAGTLTIGSEATDFGDYDKRDPVVQGIEISAKPTLLAESFDADTDLPVSMTGVSKISSELLNAAGLEEITLSVREGITLDKSADIQLNPGGSILLAGRHIEHHGTVTIPQGTVTFRLLANETSLESGDNYISAADVGYERIFLSGDSLIDVSGRQIDFFEPAQSGGTMPEPGFIAGGSVILEDLTHYGEGVVLMPTASIDVSGGWQIDTAGEVTGGDGGTIRMTGTNLMLGGDLYAHSLSDAEGGTLDLHAQKMTVTADSSAPTVPFAQLGAKDALPTGADGHLILDTGRIDNTGATTVKLTSVTDIIVEDGAQLSPSTLKLATPVVAAEDVNGNIANLVVTEETGDAAFNSDYLQMALDEIRGGAITLVAGKALGGEYRMPTDLVEQNQQATARIDAQAAVIASPQGSIDISGPAVHIEGQISAPAGTIQLTATSTLEDMALTIASGAQVSASAFHPVVDNLGATGLPAAYQPLDGGLISLSSAMDVNVAAGAVLDVSGVEPVETLALGQDGIYSSAWVAGSPGTIDISYFNQFDMQGELRGHAVAENMQGGTLSITKTDPTGSLNLSPGDMETYVASGFDDLTFVSLNRLVFDESLDTAIGRKLTLDAPVISTAGQSVALRAPWIVLQNTYAPNEVTPVEGIGRLILAGDWIDIEGDVVLSGFDHVSLNAGHDIRLADRFYPQVGTSAAQWQGRLQTQADMVFNADRVYPTTGSVFSIVTGGDVTTLSTVSDPSTNAVYSAGGSLSLTAANIFHNGRWMAPMGQLQMTASTASGEKGRIYLDGDSVLSVTGDTQVNYGNLDEDAIVWLTTDKTSGSSTSDTLLEQQPETAVLLSGEEVIMQDGAQVDASGGGEIFAYQWLKSTEGSVDPLKVTGRMVIVPGMSDALPGLEVVLEGNDLIEAGTYTVLPESYAFLDGAMVIEDLGYSAALDANGTYTQEGYAVSVGRTVASGTDLAVSPSHYFSVRPASEVLSEGTFTVQQMTVGDAGDIAINGNTTILSGKLNAAPIEGYTGGAISFSSRQIIAGSEETGLPVGFIYNSPVPEELSGRLTIDATAITGGGFDTVAIGDLGITESVVFESGAELTASNVLVSAIDGIDLETGSRISATSESGGNISLVSPEGQISIGADASLEAAGELRMETLSIAMDGEIAPDTGALHLVSDCIIVAADGAGEGASEALTIDGAFWSKIKAIDDISLSSRTDIVFQSDFQMDVAQALNLDADRIVLDSDTAVNVAITASQIHLTNSSLSGEMSSTSESSPEGGGGTIALNADDLFIHFGAMADTDADDEALNDLTVGGTDGLILNVANDIIFSGEGALSTDGDVTLTSAGISVAPTEINDSDGRLTLTTADVGLISTAGAIVTRSNGNLLGTVTGYGGAITLQGRSIDHGGRIDSPSGTIRLVTTGVAEGDGIVLGQGAQLTAVGTDQSAGGLISLETGSGSIEIAADALVDVSAGNQGDAGTLSLIAPQGNVRILSELKGNSLGGKGGSINVDTLSFGDFASLSHRLTSGGFSGEIALRARQGDVIIGSADSLAASAIMIAADAGSVDLQGTIDVSQSEQGGRLEIYAGNDIHFFSGGRVYAGASDPEGDGGHVHLATQSGTIQLDAGAGLNMSGGTGGSGGTLSLRAPRTDSGMLMDLNANVSGAATITAEGFAVYDGVSTVLASGGDGNETVGMDSLLSEAVTWMNELDFQHGLGGVADGVFQIMPGIEIRSTGDMVVQQAISFSSYAGDLTRGVLTLRSAGDLAVNANIVDARTDSASLREETAQPSWGIQLVAGADLAGSDPLAVADSVQEGKGHLTTGDEVLVYSESASIRFASAGNTVLGSPGTLPLDPMTSMLMAYSLGSFSGTVEGRVAGDLIVKDGGIQTAIGDIRVKVNENLILRDGSTIGAIRTVGEATTDQALLWEYANGGDISIHVGGDIKGVPLASDAWDAAVYGEYYIPSYEDGGVKGIATLAGGDVSIAVSGEMTCAVGTFGKGDLSIVAGKGLNGRFLIRDGQANLSTYENFGMGDRLENQPIEAFDAQINLTAQGTIELGSVLNPTIANKDFAGKWNLGYSPDSSVALSSVRGDVILTGETRYYTSHMERSQVLPATLTIDAADDIIFGAHFTMAPSSTGNLVLTAGGDIHSKTNASGDQEIFSLTMSDVAPSKVYGYHSADDEGYNPFSTITDATEHDPDLLHEEDKTVAIIHAGGDIRDLKFYVPKASEIIAGGDIADIYFQGQNVHLDDTTTIFASGDICFSSGLHDNFQTGFEIGGSGNIVVAAGNEIDLGTTKGIQAVGTLYNPSLPTPDPEEDDPSAKLLVFAGLQFDAGEGETSLIENMLYKIDDTDPLFEQLREQGKKYSEAMAEGDIGEAAQILSAINQDVIDPYFSDMTTGSGDINMVNSQIYTNGDFADINIVATGEVNVGRSTFKDDGDGGENSGIYTTGGGAINVFLNGDLNVNESRMMTFMGGDITAWTQYGNINAGRGSKTAINVASPKLEEDENGNIEIIFSPPAVGSGIRALTFDPDGLEGPRTQPEAGDLYLFAPAGEIDAGEAGIAGKNIVLAATQVINAQNIEVGGSSVGVPDTSASTAGLGALAGSGAVSETSNVGESQTGLGSAKERFNKYVTDLGDTLVPNWLAVEVLGFGDPETSSPGDGSGQDDDREEK